MRCFVALEILVDTSTCSTCVEQKPVVARAGLDFSWPVILAGMTVTCSPVLVETLTAPEYICALSSFSEDSWASTFQQLWYIRLICSTVASLLLQQQMAPRKLCWMLSLCLVLSTNCAVLKLCLLFSGVSCMAQDCLLRTPEDFVFPLLPSEELKDKYRRYLFRDYVEVLSFSDLKYPGSIHQWLAEILFEVSCISD